MMFKGQGIYNASFEVFADNYHSVRPGYPDVLFQDIRQHAGIADRSRLLEIGAGSGIATAKLAEFGGPLLAIEPGKHLAEIARQHNTAHAHVTILEGTFEDFTSDERFEAIFAFTAFHWLKEGNKFQRVSDLLADDGSLVLTWNSFLQAETEAMTEVNALYRELLSDVYPETADAAHVNARVLEKLSGREQEIAGNPLFTTTFLCKYLSTYTYDADTYPKLLNTYPKIIGIEDVRRKEFLRRVGKIVAKHKTLSVPVLTTLIIAKKRAYLQMMASNG